MFSLGPPPRSWHLLISATFVLALVSQGAETKPLFREVGAAESGITWIHENGRSEHRYLPETTGAGVAIFDYNNDGWMDIFLVNSGHQYFLFSGNTSALGPLPK